MYIIKSSNLLDYMFFFKSFVNSGIIMTNRIHDDTSHLRQMREIPYKKEYHNRNVSCFQFLVTKLTHSKRLIYVSLHYFRQM